MDLGKSLREIFQAPVRFMKESLEKESVFEKPYLSGGYREMHYKPPGPDGEKPKPIQYPDCGTLICTERGECDFAVAMWKLTDWSPPLPRGYPDKGTWTVEGSECDGVSCFDYIMSYFDSVTLALGQGTLDGGPGIRFKINPEGAIPDETDKTIGHCHFFITHKTEWGEICSWEWSIQCPLECTQFNLVVLCQVDGVQLGYGSDCDTVAREACVTVHVGGEIGGEPEYRPYKWTISGTGFHFDAVDGPTTKTTPTATTQVLICTDDTACGTGTVTVTDACGNTGTDYVRCTEGQWTYVKDGCDYPGVADGYDGGLSWWRVVEKWKQVSWYGLAGSGGYGECVPTPGTTPPCAIDCVEFNCSEGADPGYTIKSCHVNGLYILCNKQDTCDAGEVLLYAAYTHTISKVYEWTCVP